VTLSIAVKPITIVFLPFVGLLWAGKEAGWLRKFAFWGLTAGLSLGILALMSLVNGFGFGWINGLSAPGSIYIWYAPVGLIGLVVASLANAFGLDGLVLADWVFDAGKLLSVGIVAWQIFRGGHDRLIRRLTLAFAAIVVLAPMIQSWYVVWLIPLFAVTGIRNDWQVKALYFVVSFFMIYAISDQLEVFPYLQTADLGLALALARVAAAVTGLLFGLYLIFWDPVPAAFSGRPASRCLSGPSFRQVLQCLPAGEWADLSLVGCHKVRHPIRCRFRVFPQGPANRFPDEEFGVRQVHFDDAAEEPGIRVGLGLELRGEGRAPDPEVRICAPGQNDGGHFRPVGLQQCTDAARHAVSKVPPRPVADDLLVDREHPQIGGHQPARCQVDSGIPFLPEPGGAPQFQDRGPKLVAGAERIAGNRRGRQPTHLRHPDAQRGHGGFHVRLRAAARAGSARPRSWPRTRSTSSRFTMLQL
jgi:hypothetical protein